MSTKANKYTTIADDLERRIRAGEFTADPDRARRLPTQGDLIAEYKAQMGTMSLGTIKRALDILEDDRGLITTLEGKGSFVVDPIPDPVDATEAHSTAKIAAKLRDMQERAAEQESETQAVIRSLQKKVAKIEEAVDELRVMIMDLYSKIGQPHPGAEPEEVQRHGRAG